MTRNLLALRAIDRTGQAAVCTFKATADGSTLATKDDTEPIFEIPTGTQTVEVTATPRRPVFWEETFSFSIDADGSLTADVDFRPRVELTVAANFVQRLTLAKVKVSQFRDSTPHVLDLLNHPPSTRRIFNAKKKKWEEPEVHEVEAHQKIYGTWPPPDWDLHGVPASVFLDVANPVKSGALSFARDPSLGADLDVESVVLERAGVRPVPQYFAVTWPQAIAPKVNAPPTPFLLYIRQSNKYNGYDLQGIFVGGGLPRYPDNFDYADSGMFESLHYAGTPPSVALPPSPFWDPNSKGVPYQAAKAGANVVTVLPCNSFEENYLDMNDPEETETILQELQAFMFWSGGIAAPPKSLGKTAIAAFSSGTYFLGNWLQDDAKRKGHFLSSVVRAVYFLEPARNYVWDGKSVPVLDEFVASALKWAAESPDKRIRLYMQYPWPSLKKLVDKPLPAAPFFVNSSDDKRTVSVVTNATWTKTFGRPPSKPIPWVYVHHSTAATMLTHALAQSDFSPTP